MDKYSAILVAKQFELSQLDDEIKELNVQISKRMEENQKRKNKVETLTDEISRLETEKRVLMAEKTKKKSALKRALGLSSALALSVTAVNLTGIANLDWLVLVPTTILSVPVYAINMVGVNRVKDKYSLTKITDLIKKKKEEKEQTFNKAKSVTQEIIAMRNQVSSLASEERHIANKIVEIYTLIEDKDEIIKDATLINEPLTPSIEEKPKTLVLKQKRDI